MRAAVIVSTLLALAACGERAAEERPPNFVLIFVDDMGYGDIGPFGSTVNRTPNLDRMAAEGMKLTSFYAAPVCTPSRAALMTGSYANRVSLDQGGLGHVLFPGDPEGLHGDEITVAEILQEQGYATAIIGKWHLGDQPQFLPTRHGFDYYFGLPYSNDMILEHPRVGELRQYPPLPLMRNEKPERALPYDEQHILTTAYTEEAVRFIRERKDEPFFVYLPHTMVHVPLFAGGKFQGVSENGVLGDCIEEIDWGVGRILGTLRELGLEEDTFVLFTSDNGPARGSEGPLRGRKGSTYEGGLRVPTIAWRPGWVPAGTESDEVTSVMDVLPTFARMAGAQPPQDRIIDGVDITAILRGEPGAKVAREALYYYRVDELRAVRSGPWKLHANGELYNLDEDIGESRDVAAANPDAVARLEALLEAAREDLGDAGRPGQNIRPAGRVEDPKFLIPRPTGEPHGAMNMDAQPPQAIEVPENW